MEFLSIQFLKIIGGSLERFHSLEKCKLTSQRCPSAERLGTTLGTTVLHFLWNGWGQPFYTFYWERQLRAQGKERFPCSNQPSGVYRTNTT